MARIYYNAVFSGHGGRMRGDNIQVMQNAIETDLVFDCFFEDGEVYNFVGDETITCYFRDVDDAADYQSVGTFTPGTGTNQFTWLRDASDVGTPSLYKITFKVVPTSGDPDFSIVVEYRVDEVPDGTDTPLPPPNVGVTPAEKAWLDVQVPALAAMADGQIVTVSSGTLADAGFAMSWNATDSTVDVPLNANVTGQMFQELLIYARNSTGSQIDNGDIVRLNGTTGDRVTITLAQADTHDNAQQVGMATEDIATGTAGFVAIIGLVRGQDTNSFTEGDQLYLSAVTPGLKTNVKPTWPAISIEVGLVQRKHPSDGIVFVNAYETGAGAWEKATDAAAAAGSAALADLLAYPNIEEAITKPVGFAYNPAFDIIKSSSVFYPINDGRMFDVRRLFVEGDGVYYVDVNTGNDSNAGTPQSPLKSINAAIGKADATTVYIAPGHYDRVSGGVSGGEYTKSINLIKNGEGDVYISRRQSGLVWVQDGTYTNCYTATRSLTFTVLDDTTTDSDGDILRYTLAASEADCDATAGSWFIDGANKVYVHTFDDRAADSDIWVLVSENIIRFAGDITVYCEGLSILGGSTTAAVWHQSSATGQRPKLFMKDCSILYSAGNGVATEGAFSIIQNTRAAKNTADGFNYHTQDSIIISAIEVDCTGFKNGIDANDNGSSMHDGGSVIRINGAYNENTGPNVIDIDSSESWNLGCTANDGDSQGFSILGNMWIDTCVATGNAGDDIVSNAASFLRHRNSTFDTTGGAGTIESY